SARACRLRLNFPTAALVRGLKTARQSKVHLLLPNRVRAAPAPPVKATCFKLPGTEVVAHRDCRDRRVDLRTLSLGQNGSDYPFMKMKVGVVAEPSSCLRVMCSHRLAPAEKNKENENDTHCLGDGGRSDADIGRFRRFASRADCASQRRGH